MTQRVSETVELATAIVKKLRRTHSTLVVAESITGGGIGAAITSVPRSSEVFLGGVIAYSDQVKKKFLQVPQRVLTRNTAVSEQVVTQMARAVRRDFGATYSIAVTGVAGPGKSYGQRAGTVWLAIDTPRDTHVVPLHLAGDRTDIRHATISSALATFARILSS